MLAYLLLAALQTAPAAEAPAPAPVDAAAAPAADKASDTPSGAPTDDYGFVAWCRGALSGHMELYKQVKPELARLEAEKAATQEKTLKTPEARAAAKAERAKEAKEDAQLDAQQLAAGADYIKLYGRALDAAESASPTPIHARGEEMIAQGYRIWAAARAADDRTRMWSYIMWELPARCETAAKALESNSSLFGQAFKAAAPAEAAPAPASPAEAAPAPTGGEAASPPPASPEAAPPTTTPAPTDAAPTTPAQTPTPTIDTLIASPPPADPPASPDPKAAEAPAAPPPLRTSPQG